MRWRAPKVEGGEAPEPPLLRSAAVACVAAAILTASVASAADAAHLAAAGHGDHLWVVRGGKDGPKTTILHRTPAAPAGTLYRADQTTVRPTAVAAYRRRLFLLYRPVGGEGHAAQVIQFAPSDEAPWGSYEWSQLPPLPDVEPLDWAAGASGPVALVATDEGKPKLLRTQGRGWEPIETPEGLTGTPARLVAVTPAADEMAVVVGGDGKAGAVYIHDGESWSRTAYSDLALAAETAAVAADRQLVLVDRTERTRLTARVLRDGRTYPIGGVDADAFDRWAAVGRSGRGVGVVLGGPADALAWAEMGLRSRQSVTPEPLTVDKVPEPRADPTIVVAAAVAVAMIYLLVMARRNPQANLPKLPEGMVPAGILPRALAGAVDLAAPAALVLISLGVRRPGPVIEMMVKWVSWPSPDATWADILPGVAILGLYLLHTGVAEWLAMRSLGKWLLGCRVVEQHGADPALWQILVRNLFKAVELVAPLLLILPLLSLYRQRLGDLVGRTVVVRRPTAGSEPCTQSDPTESDDRREPSADGKEHNRSAVSSSSRPLSSPPRRSRRGARNAAETRLGR